MMTPVFGRFRFATASAGNRANGSGKCVEEEEAALQERLLEIQTVLSSADFTKCGTKEGE